MQLHLPLDRLIIEERAIGAVEIVDKCLLTPTNQSAMAFADYRARWPQMAFWIAANDGLRQCDWDGLSSQFAGRHHHQC